MSKTIVEQKYNDYLLALSDAIPDQIFHFHCYNDYNLHALANNYLYLASTKAFNDPFEGHYHKSTLHLNGIEDLRVENWGIHCFSKNPYEPNMWGIYTDKSKGFCLIFNSFELFPKLSKKVKSKKHLGTEFRSDLFDFNDNDENIFRVGPVEYVDDDELGIKMKTDHFGDSLFYKSKHWAPEGEIRLLCMGNNHTNEYGRKDVIDREYSYLPKAISGVIFGSQTSAYHKDIIKKLLSHTDYKHVGFYEAEPNYKECEIKIRNIKTKELLEVN